MRAACAEGRHHEETLCHNTYADQLTAVTRAFSVQSSVLKYSVPCSSQRMAIQFLQILRDLGSVNKFSLQVLEDEQINLSRAAERLLSLREEAKILAEKGPAVGEPAAQGQKSDASLCHVRIAWPELASSMPRSCTNSPHTGI